MNDLLLIRRDIHIRMVVKSQLFQAEVLSVCHCTRAGPIALTRSGQALIALWILLVVLVFIATTLHLLEDRFPKISSTYTLYI
jgi:hypothetical protein